MTMAQKVSYWIVMAVLCVAPGFATTATMTLTGPGQNGMLNDTYIGPYVATINNVPNLQVICDDFVDNTYLNENWTVNVQTLPTITGTDFASQGLAKYEQAAWLSLQLLNPNSTCIAGVTNCAGDIQFAIWQVFDSTPAAQAPFSYLSGKDLTSAQNWLTMATNHYNDPGIDYSAFSIFTPNQSYPITCSGQNCTSTPPQEFIVVRTPEPPVLAILGTDLSALGFLVFFLKRRLIS